MTCEQCQEFISAFLDDELAATDSANVQTHLAVCAECAKVCEDFATILDFCVTEETSCAELPPPNSQAMWCRINNIIESEVKPEIAPETIQPEVRRGWFSRAWSLSFSQAASAVLGIALISSLLTVIGVRNYAAAPGDDLAARADAAPTLVDKFLGKFGFVETTEQKREQRLKEQRAAIEYWNARVQTRRDQWDRHLREAFDRNLHEINQAVDEYTLILQDNPQDELSGEMLDSAMNEKMELLREFSDL